MTVVLLLKLLLAPGLVGAASLAGRRFGQRVVGLMAALPIVGGPLLLFYALDHGAAFVARAAEQALSGVFSLSAYCVAYGWLAWSARRCSRRWILVVLPLSWGVFLACTAVLSVWVPSGVAGALLAAAGLGLGAQSLPHLGPGDEAENPSRRSAASKGAKAPGGLPGSVELGLRMVATALLVGTLSAASGALGPELSGLLTPFPVASTVLLVATHLLDGPSKAVVLLRGFLSGMWGFAVFCGAIAWTALPLGPVPAFGLGLLGVAASQWAALTYRPRTSNAP